MLQPRILNSDSSDVFTYCSKLQDVRAKLCRPDVWKPLGLMLVLG